MCKLCLFLNVNKWYDWGEGMSWLVEVLVPVVVSYMCVVNAVLRIHTYWQTTGITLSTCGRM